MKLRLMEREGKRAESPPTRGRGLKPDRLGKVVTSLRSPPTRGRGLKLEANGLRAGATESPPTRGRGLKHDQARQAQQDYDVAPHAGAWIETQTLHAAPLHAGMSPPTRGRGLKHLRA